MSDYGNIFTFFAMTQEQSLLIEALITAAGNPFQRLENVFFVRTVGHTQTKKLVDDMSALDVTFVFFHVDNEEQSFATSKNITQELFQKIENLLFPYAA